jgi:hypothetical protein
VSKGDGVKIDVDRHNNLRLKEVYSGILLETSEGDQIGICMRDDTFEINVCPHGRHGKNWWRVNMQKGTIEQMGNELIGTNDEADNPFVPGLEG